MAQSSIEVDFKVYGLRPALFVARMLAKLGVKDHTALRIACAFIIVRATCDNHYQWSIRL